MRRLSLAFVLVVAACSSGVTNPNDDTDEDLGGGDTDNDATDFMHELELLNAQILGTDHLVDGSGSITLEALPSSVAGVTYSWAFGDGSTGTGVTTSHTYAGKGCFAVTLTLNAPTANPAEATAQVYAPTDSADASVDALPQAHGFVARSPGAATATLAVSGTMTSPGWQKVAVDIVADGAVVRTDTAELCATSAQSFTVNAQLPVALKSYDVNVRAVAGARSQTLTSVEDLVAGDVLIIQGQSNAVAADITGITLPTSTFVRSFGSAAIDEATSVADSTWHTADGNVSNSAGSIGQWGIKMALDLLAVTDVPLAIFNGAHGGQPITWFQRDDANHANTANNYGRLLRRVRAAGLDQHVRAVLYFQGESDGSNAVGHRDGFTALYDDWRDDFPTIEKLYITQVRPGCGAPSLDLRNYQRTMGTTLINARTMSTSAMDAHDGCHYHYTGGYELLGQQYARLLGHDLYAQPSSGDLEAIDVSGATYDAANQRILVQLTGDATIFLLETGMEAYFVLTGTDSVVNSVALQDHTLILGLSAGTGAPTSVGYDGHQGVGPTVLNGNGVGLLAFLLPL
jgi:PKD repeat protein